jgi:serine/threonine-protein kinase PknG
MPCGRAGCTGQIEDGYCNVCGMAAQETALASTGSAPGSGAASSGSGPSSASLGTSGPVSGRLTSGRTRPSTGTSRRGMLGAGLVEVPPVPYRDPATAILADPEVPERKRFCSSCGQPVGRAADGHPGRAQGFCRRCGARFSFTPKLAKGDLVAGQYEVIGCLAHGGLGWIYLAHDRNVSDRWVVLKGLLDSGDAEAMAAAVAERQFLARVEHPNIVKIYNFVQHPDPDTGALGGYIVMEYVGGQSLREMLVARHRPDGSADPLPVSRAIAYALEVLRALGYLHEQGLLYCDFKPDNVIQSEEQIKLIDLGGVRRMDDDVSAIYGTIGYQAPEIADEGPSVSSDLYTVARSLAVLTFDFKGYSGNYATSLPARAEVPVLARLESFDRLLRRATDQDRTRRFGSAAEMAEQLTGVLREVLAAEDGEPRPGVSALFGPETRAPFAETGIWPANGHSSASGSGPAGGYGSAGRSASAGGSASASAGGSASASAGGSASAPAGGSASAAAGLPVPLVDGTDPGAGYLAGLSAAAPADLGAILAHAPVSSTEVSLRLARVYLELADFDAAAKLLDGLAVALPGDWRIDWHRALAELARAGPAAVAQFDELYSLLPGEIAPKLALAVAAELRGDLASASRYYQLVWTTDRSYVSAAFGLARVHLAQGDRAAAVAALDSVPASSIHYVRAQVAAIAARIRGRDADGLESAAVLEAGSRLEQLGLDAERREWLEAEVLAAALSMVQAGSAARPGRSGPPEPAGGPVRVPVSVGRASVGPVSVGRASVGPVSSEQPGGSVHLLGCELSERELRLGLERAYRALAHLANDPAERTHLVDQANRVRPWTLL